MKTFLLGFLASLLSALALFGLMWLTGLKDGQFVVIVFASGIMMTAFACFPD